MHASWPVAGPEDKLLIRSSEYLMDAAHEFRLRLKTVLNPGKNKVGHSARYSKTAAVTSAATRGITLADRTAVASAATRGITLADRTAVASAATRGIVLSGTAAVVGAATRGIVLSGTAAVVGAATRGIVLSGTAGQQQWLVLQQLVARGFLRVLRFPPLLHRFNGPAH